MGQVCLPTEGDEETDLRNDKRIWKIQFGDDRRAG